MVSASIGIIFAFVAMLCWGFGDFLIQRSTRRLGDWETLFLITLFGTIILFPFSFSKIGSFLESSGVSFWVVIIASGAMLVAAISEFESLRRGKITVVEPIWSMEIPMSVFLAFIILNEKLSTGSLLLIALLIVGLVLVSARETSHFKKFFLEKGAILALFAALGMGATNFLVGWGARETDPIFVNFVMNVILTFGAGLFLLAKGRLKQVFYDFKNNPYSLGTMVIADNVAWIAFAFAMTLAPIGIAVALSESYIIIAVLLGFFINKERLQIHQKIGLALAIVSAIILSSFIV